MSFRSMPPIPSATHGPPSVGSLFPTLPLPLPRFPSPPASFSSAPAFSAASLPSAGSSRHNLQLASSGRPYRRPVLLLGPHPCPFRHLHRDRPTCDYDTDTRTFQQGDLPWPSAVFCSSMTKLPFCSP